MTTLLRLDEVLRSTSLTRRTLFRINGVAASVAITERLRGWIGSEVDSWIAQRFGRTRAAPRKLKPVPTKAINAHKENARLRREARAKREAALARRKGRVKA